MRWHTGRFQSNKHIQNRLTLGVFYGCTGRKQDTHACFVYLRNASFWSFTASSCGHFYSDNETQSLMQTFHLFINEWINPISMKLLLSWKSQALRAAGRMISVNHIFQFWHREKKKKKTPVSSVQTVFCSNKVRWSKQQAGGIVLELRTCWVNPNQM